MPPHGSIGLRTRTSAVLMPNRHLACFQQYSSQSQAVLTLAEGGCWDERNWRCTSSRVLARASASLRFAGAMVLQRRWLEGICRVSGVSERGFRAV